MNDFEMHSHPNNCTVIPAHVMQNKNLCPNAKVIYSEITELCNRYGYCRANNSYFATRFKMTVRSIRRWLSQLKEEGFIHIEYFDNGSPNPRKIWIKHSHLGGNS